MPPFEYGASAGALRAWKYGEAQMGPWGYTQSRDPNTARFYWDTYGYVEPTLHAATHDTAHRRMHVHSIVKYSESWQRHGLQAFLAACP